MKIEPLAGPAQVEGTVNSMQKAAAARDRAIAMLTQAPTQTQEHPVQNPSNVAPEELGAVRPSEVQNDKVDPALVPEVPKREPELSAQYAQLARKEKALRARDIELKRREEAVRSKETPAPPAPTFDESKYISKDRLKEDLWATLGDAGISYDAVTQAALNQPDSTTLEIKRLNSRLEAQERENKEYREKAQKAQEEQQSQSYKQAVHQIRNDVTKLVANDPAFEMVKHTKSVNDVVDLIVKTFQQDNEILSIEEATQAIEEYLVDEALRLSNLPKIQKKQKSVPAPAQKTQSGAPQQSQQQRTLTNSMSASRPLSSRDRAIAAFNANKKIG